MLFVLAKFDVRVGNQVVWTSEPVERLNLPGVEFKMIPSGLHDRTKDTIFFVCGGFHGVARYEARVQGHGRSPDEGKFFSLAALVPLDADFPWGLESFLAMELRKFLDLGAATDATAASIRALPTTAPLRTDARCHPLLSTSEFLETYGPMVFELWKAGLSRARTLLSPIPGHSIRTMSRFTYIAAQISALPQDVAELVPGYPRPQVPTLYNVSVSDLQRLQSAESFWATTTDGLLLTPSRDACDCYADNHVMHDLTSGSPEKLRWPTWRDRSRFALLVDALNLHGIPACLGLREAIIDGTVSGLLWWASAGESTLMERDETAPLLNAPQGFDAASQANTSLTSIAALDSTSDVVALIGQFQQYSRQFVQVFAKLAADDDPVIRINIQDIAAMGLDPFAGSDREFIQRFALAWWDRPAVFVRCCC